MNNSLWKMTRGIRTTNRIGTTHFCGFAGMLMHGAASCGLALDSLTPMQATAKRCESLCVILGTAECQTARAAPF
jgi:hypothetical protein